MRFLLACLGALLLLMPLTRAHAQDRDVRFAITTVGDTTITFQAGKMTWVVRTKGAIVVDPRRRDALVARLRVMSVGANGEATAVVTEQAGRITTDHVVIGTEPPVHWYRNALLWMGAAFGLAAGFGLGKL
jgi:hypothetical protein